MMPAKAARFIKRDGSGAVSGAYLQRRILLLSISDDETSSYHDGKWRTFEPTDTSLFEDCIRLLAIKRKTNRK